MRDAEPVELHGQPGHLQLELPEASPPGLDEAPAGPGGE